MRLRSFSTALAVGTCAILLAAAAPAQTKKFTVNADFDTGNLNGVVHVPADELVLGPTAVSKTSIVWATNYLYGYVVRLDTTTGKQTGRFDSGLVTINGQATGARPAQEYCDFSTTGNCPGRVAVDANGDVWIVNRAFSHQGTLSKFSGDIAHCIDRNNNGVIDTSFDKNNDGVIDVNPAAGEYFGQNDECIITTIPIGPFNVWPRGVAVDKNGKIWVSTFQDGKLYRYNPNDPVTLEATVSLNGAGAANPYSLATGGDYVFASDRGAGGTRRVHITTLAVNNLPTCPATYGVVADPSGGWAWLGGWGGDGIYKANFLNNTCVMTSTGGGVTATTLDLAGNIWGANYLNGTVNKLNPAGVLIGTYPAGGGNPHGMSVDFKGNIWVITHTAGSELVKINPNTGAIIGKYSIGGPGVPNADPYIYSDFTGVQINRQAPYAKLGSWDATFDGGGPAIPWSTITWNTEAQGAVPAGATLVIAARAADTLGALGATAYAPAVSGAALPKGIKGRYVQMQASLKGPGYVTAVLSDITVTGPCPSPSQACCAKDADCDDGNTCTADTCPVPGGACQHAPVLNCCATAADCNDQNQCTTDTCPVAGGSCVHTAQAACCNSNADCADGDLCTTDICSGPGGVCSHPVINGCCNTDLDCTKGNKCSNATCPVPGGFCQGGMVPGCCAQDADCADMDLCTKDTCDVPTATCANTKVAGCCNVDGDCNDNNTCTSDHCTGKGGTCVFNAIPGCCSPNDPLIGTPCEAPVSPFDKPPCKAGKLECMNGAFKCTGSVKPALEICDGVDNNCDGVVDAPNPCAMGLQCIDGVCDHACKSGEFPCESGLQCVDGVCFPTTCDKVVCPSGLICKGGLCKSADAGADTTASSSSGMSASSGSGGVGGAGAGGGPTFATASATGATGATSTGSGHAATSGNPGSIGQSGGCGCEVPGQRDAGSPGGLALAATAIAAALGRGRRRTSRSARGGAR